MSFNYLHDRIRDAEILTEPFRHIEIHDFFSTQHLAQIVSAPEIAIERQDTDAGVFDALFAQGYKIIEFPGCITNKDTYLKWHRNKSVVRRTSSACEGFGITLRLMAPRSSILDELSVFLSSAEFQATLAEKFDIDLADVFYDSGIQKYLDGYEISPHPDIRRKALTYMVNVNPAPDSETRDHHTHYLKFRDEYRYVQSYWEGRPGEDRCWVPWNWCDSVKTQRANNSIVVFSPGNATLHGVKTSYDHLSSQRTQLYGNLWYHQSPAQAGPEWEDFAIAGIRAGGRPSLLNRVKSVLPTEIKEFVRNSLPFRTADPQVISNRLRGK